jgi:hypothetical protein
MKKDSSNISIKSGPVALLGLMFLVALWYQVLSHLWVSYIFQLVSVVWVVWILYLYSI